MVSNRMGVLRTKDTKPTEKLEHEYRIIEWVVYWQSSQRSCSPGRKLKLEFWTTLLNSSLYFCGGLSPRRRGGLPFSAQKKVVPVSG
jgi:hypothetical protein